jgi:AcrR family transcriptional regulator
MASPPSITRTITRTTTTDPHRQDDPRVERTRAAVIEAASELLMADGPSAITHANVATAANVSRTTVYNHWPTREDLLRATIDSIGTVTPALDDLTGSLRDDLAMLCAPLVAKMTDEQRAPMIANMMERALHDPTVAAVRDDFLASFRLVFARVIHNAIAAGELRSDIDVDRSLAALMGSFLFVRFMSDVVFDDAMAQAILDDFVSVNAPR